MKQHPRDRVTWCDAAAVLAHFRRLAGLTRLVVCSGNHDLTGRDGNGERHRSGSTMIASPAAIARSGSAAVSESRSGHSSKGERYFEMRPLRRLPVSSFAA